MLNRRQRVIVHCHSVSTLQRVRDSLGRSIELIVTADVPTLEAALRLYQQVAALVVEKKPKSDLPLGSLRLAAEKLPAMPRIALVDCESIGGVTHALVSGLVTRLLMIPFSAGELIEAVGVSPPVYPPLTGGMRATSSPSFSR